jgi:hypothetical protein
MGSKLRHPVKPTASFLHFQNATMDILAGIMSLLRTNTHLYGRLPKLLDEYFLRSGWKCPFQIGEAEHFSTEQVKDHG